MGCSHGYLSRVSCRLHMSQLMPLPLMVSCFSKIQFGFTFLVSAYPGNPGKGPLSGCVCVFICYAIWLRQVGEREHRQIFGEIWDNFPISPKTGDEAMNPMTGYMMSYLSSSTLVFHCLLCVRCSSLHIVHGLLHIMFYPIDHLTLQKTNTSTVNAD